MGFQPSTELLKLQQSTPASSLLAMAGSLLADLSRLGPDNNFTDLVLTAQGGSRAKKMCQKFPLEVEIYINYLLISFLFFKVWMALFLVRVYKQQFQGTILLMVTFLGFVLYLGGSWTKK